MNKTKILYSIRQTDFGGGETHLDYILNSLPKNYEPILLTLSKGYYYQRFVSKGIKIYAINRNSPLSIVTIYKVTKLIKENRIDIIHAHGTKGALAILIPSLLTKTKFIYTVHSFSFHPGINYLSYIIRKQIEKLITLFATFIIFVSKTDFEKANFVNPNKKVLIPNAIDTNRFCPYNDKSLRNKFGFTENDFVIALIGRITFQKNPFFAIEIIEKLNSPRENSSNNLQFKLLVVGEGELKESLIKRVKERSLEKFVKFIDFRPDVEYILNSIDCLILPSIWEGMPYILLEAMACAVPVVASNLKSIEEVITSGENGFCEDTKDIDNFVKMIKDLASNKELYNHISEKARLTITQKFDVKLIMNDLFQLYKNVNK